MVERSNEILRHFRTLFGEGTAAVEGDAGLLKRFAAGGGEGADRAFEALVARHGPMVLGVCRRALNDPHDVEDAFQATFLVLVRRARTIKVDDSLGRWLYGVAVLVAGRARTNAARARGRKSLIPGDLPGPSLDPDRAEIRSVLDEELGRLPERFRAPIVLCCLEGLSYDEAARRLRCPSGTVKSRLARGRERLGARLARRGLAPASVLIASAFGGRVARAAVPKPLQDRTIEMLTRSVAGKAGATAGVVALARQTLRRMTMAKLKGASLILCAAGLSGLAVAQVHGARGPVEPPPREDAPGRVAAPDPEAAKPPTFANAPGCTWARAPEAIELGGSWSVSGPPGNEDGVLSGYSVVDAEDALQLVLVQVAPEGRATAEFRPVVFDAGGERYLPEGAGGVGYGGKVKLGMNTYRLDPKILLPSRAARFAVERVTPEAHRIAAAGARKKAAEHNIALLPPPRIGEAFPFELPAVGGSEVRSRDLLGKVVLIDCWATWCTPCMAKMPKLKELYRARKAEGFAIVGIGFDDPEKGERVIDELALPWPQVLVSRDDDRRQLWMEGSEIPSLPHLLLVDRRGILRAVCMPSDVEEKVGELLREPKP